MLDFKLDMDALAEESKKATLDFIKSHTNSIVGMMALSDVMNSKSVPSNKMKSLYEGFVDRVKDTPLGRMLGKKYCKDRRHRCWSRSSKIFRTCTKWKGANSR